MSPAPTDTPDSDAPDAGGPPTPVAGSADAPTPEPTPEPPASAADEPGAESESAPADTTKPAKTAKTAKTTDSGAQATSDETGFASLGLRPELVSAVNELGYEEPTPIQREAIPVVLSGKDLLGLAATGTGKTAAFALPLLQGLRNAPNSPNPAALVLVPTRELAIQVAEAVHRYGRGLGIRVLPIYGGSSMGQQLRVLRRGVDVVVATPGRAIDHLDRGTLRLDDVGFVVLDEADEMLDMGFAEDLEKLLGATPPGRQMALFSATFPRRLRDIATRSLNEPVRIEVAREKTAPGEMPRIRQLVFVVRRHDKRAALCRVLDMENAKSSLVFCRTRIEVEALTEALQSRGYAAEALHGGLNQAQRDRAMGRLRAGSADLIVATDVAARGIDIQHLTHVINFDPPAAPEQYTHRIGRTGRAGREGTAITFLEPRERRLAHRIEQITGQPVESARVPSAAALRARRLDALREQVRAAVAEDEDLEAFRAICDSLMEDMSAEDLAAACMKALHQASWNDDLEEIPSDPLSAPARQQRGVPERRQARAPSQGANGNWTRLFIGIGRKERLRAGDLLGAILNETGLPRDAVGRIEIAFSVSFVEIRADAADRVIAALRSTNLRGRRVPVHRDRGHNG